MAAVPHALADSPVLEVVLSFLGLADLAHLSHSCKSTHSRAFWELVSAAWPVRGPGVAPGGDNVRGALAAYLSARRGTFFCPSTTVGGAWVTNTSYWKRGADATALFGSTLHLTHVWWLDVCATHVLPPPLPRATSTPFAILLRVRSSSRSWQHAARSVALEPLELPFIADGGGAGTAEAERGAPAAAAPRFSPGVAVVSAAGPFSPVPPRQWVWLYMGRAEVRGGSSCVGPAAAPAPPRVTWRLRDTDSTLKQGLDIDCSVAARADVLDSLATQARWRAGGWAAAFPAVVPKPRASLRRPVPPPPPLFS